MMGFTRWSLVASVGFCAACGGGEEPGVTPGPGNSTPGGQHSGAGSGNPGSGTTGNPAGGNGNGGSAVGNGGSGSPVSGAGGTGGDSAGAGGTGGGAVDPNGDTPPTHPLMITAALGEHLHDIHGRPAGVDNRAPKMMGKLIIDVGVDNGGAYDFGLKHGFHVYGAQIFHCEIAEAPNTYESKTRDFNGNCRLETFDGMDHDPSANVNEASSVSGKLKQALTDLQAQYPEEDWGYYLNADGSVRWSDIGITGYSHGATSAARWAKTVRLWRVVSRSGPRDNICGQYPDGQCPDSVISSWLDEVPKTPVDRMYGFVGNGDSQYKDILFAMERMKYPGAPADINATPAPFGGSHRLFINGGHSDFLNKSFWPAMGVVWDVPKENMDYAAGL